MANPAIVLSAGLDDDPYYEDITQYLGTKAVHDDTTRWPCTPDACRLLAAQYETAKEPRLRDVALTMRALLDPAVWADTVMALPDRPLLHNVRSLSRGVGAGWQAATQSPMPDSGASALVWLDWMNGVKPEYAVSMARFRRDTTLQGRLRFEDSHRAAIGFVSARTGRNIKAELKRGYETAAGDSARLIFGYLTQQTSGLGMSPDQIATALRTSTGVDRFLANQELARQMRAAYGRLGPVDTAVQRQLYADMIRSERSGRGAPWPMIGAGRVGPVPREVFVPDTNRFVLADNLPTGLAQELSDSALFISKADWDARGRRRGGSLATFKVVGSLGPFVQVKADIFGLLPRPDDHAPYGWASGAVYVLLVVEGDWVIVSVSSYIT